MAIDKWQWLRASLEAKLERYRSDAHVAADFIRRDVENGDRLALSALNYNVYIEAVQILEWALQQMDSLDRVEAEEMAKKAGLT